MVDLPLPLGPTSAIVIEDGMTRLRDWRITVSGRDGYANVTPFNSIFPRMLDSVLPVEL